MSQPDKRQPQMVVVGVNYRLLGGPGQRPLGLYETSQAAEVAAAQVEPGVAEIPVLPLGADAILNLEEGQLAIVTENVHGLSPRAEGSSSTSIV